MEQYKIIILESRNGNSLGECNWIAGPTEYPIETLVIIVMCDRASMFSLAPFSLGVSVTRIKILSGANTGSVGDWCGRELKVSIRE